MNVILATREYGERRLFTTITDRPWRAKALARGTIAFETLGPFLLLFGVWGAVAFIVLGVLFHASIAFAMGLNTFFWSFLAAYPALLFASTRFG